MLKTKQVNSWSTSSTWTVWKRYVAAAILLTTASHTGMESWKTWRQFCLLVACVAGQWRDPSCLCAGHNSAYRHYQKPDCRGGGYGFVRVQFGGESKDLSGHRRGLRGIPWLHEIAINTEEFLLVLLALFVVIWQKKNDLNRTLFFSLADFDGLVQYLFVSFLERCFADVSDLHINLRSEWQKIALL